MRIIVVEDGRAFIQVTRESKFFDDIAPYIGNCVEELGQECHTVILSTCDAQLIGCPLTCNITLADNTTIPIFGNAIFVGCDPSGLYESLIDAEIRTWLVRLEAALSEQG
jgi:hypothetical protein